MAKESQRLEQEMIATAKEKTGHDVPEWMDIIKSSGLSKQAELVKWLKSQHSLNHMQATFLTGIYLNDGKPVYDYEVMFAKLFAGKDHLMPAYHALEEQVTGNLDDVVFVPTLNYVSIEGKKIFACATFMKDVIRVGLDLGSTPFGDVVQKAKGLGAMPNLSHMIEIKEADSVTSEVLDYVQQAYDRVHQKK